MKKQLKNLLKGLIANNFTWKFLQPLARLGLFLLRERQVYSDKKAANWMHLFDSLTVQNGPFKGMRYPHLDSFGSTLYPKLLGSYEKELWEVMDTIKTSNYTEIIDVGCAEGYYAIGLALTSTNTKIYAYDSAEKARELCSEMAELNGVKDKVFIRAGLSPEGLGSFPFSGKNLIICDCEGYEKVLFNSSNLSNLQQSDILIETHDMIDMEISGYLKKLFSQTYTIQSVFSVDDIQKALTYEFDELKTLDLMSRKKILAEERGAIMEWLICRPK